MARFTLPIVGADTSLDNAFATLVESKKSGLLLKTATGDLRLLHYKELASAARNNKIKVAGEVKYLPVVKVSARASEAAQKDEIKLGGLRFGVMRAAGKTAQLVSIKEDYAYLYDTESAAKRCSRPGKPPATADRDWYHYYPPLNRPRNSTQCRVCGAPIR